MADETPKETPKETVTEQAEQSPEKTEEATTENVEKAAEEDTKEEAEASDGAAAGAAAEDSAAAEKPKGKRGFRTYNRNNRAVYHQSDDSDPSCRVYVGNLAWEVTWKELKDHMKEAGCEVTRADVLASPDGRSKGCGIVEFATAEGAQRALLLNDTELMGRQIFVREDRETGNGGGYYTQQPGTGSSGGAAAAGSGNEKQTCRVYVGNLSWEVAWQDLKDHMRDAGEVVYAEVMTDSDGRSKGCGIVEYSTAEEAKNACSTLSDTELKGRMIFVREDRETSSGGGYQKGGHHGSTSVYVGNLAYETSWQDLKDHMRGAGNVDQANILQQEDGTSKGCGIVVYQNARDASRAIRELQGTMVHGRPIFVREDREQGGRGGGRRGRGGGRGRGYGGRGGYNNRKPVTPGTQLFVNNLSFDTNWTELKDHFRQCGDVERVEVIEGPDGRKKGFGTVRFYNAKDAQNAIERLNGVELQGRELEVRLDNKAR